MNKYELKSRLAVALRALRGRPIAYRIRFISPVHLEGIEPSNGMIVSNCVFYESARIEY